MTRTLPRASALPLAVALAALPACSSGPRPPSQPAPAAQEPQPVQAPEPMGEPFELGEELPATPVPAGLLGTATYDLPVAANRWVEMELSFLVNQRHAVVGRWLQRADRYEEWVRDVFAGYGIPRDLHHLAMVESGYQATVRSRAGAVGMWQFMPATGRGMGLRIDDVVDERMDPVRSTHAAARHLRDLHRDFGGDWALAAAAYNAGGGRISRGMARFGARDFWDLAERGDLAQETRHYVPRLYAVTIIAKDRQRFGYPAPEGVVRRFAYDSVRVELETPLPELARIGNLPLLELTELNPHLFRGVAPAQYWVWVPAGQGAALQTAYRDSDFRRRGGLAYYTLRRGEDLASVAAAAGMTEDEVRSLNLSTSVDRLGRGDRVRVWADAARLLEARAGARLASDSRERGSSSPERRPSASSASRPSEGASSSRSASAGQRQGASPAGRGGSSASSSPPSSTASSSSPSAGRRTHTVEQGETLWGIARRYDVTVAQVREANDLSESQPIRPGQTLRIPRPTASANGSGRGADGGSGTRPAQVVAEHVVKSGETLWSIARSYESSVEAIRAANGMKEETVIQPGQKLRVPRTASARD